MALDEERVAGCAKDVEGDLVRHRRRRQEHRFLVAEELGASPLELVDRGILPLLLVAWVSVSERRSITTPILQFSSRQPVG